MDNKTKITVALFPTIILFSTFQPFFLVWHFFLFVVEQATSWVAFQTVGSFTTKHISAHNFEYTRLAPNIVSPISIPHAITEICTKFLSPWSRSFHFIPPLHPFSSPFKFQPFQSGHHQELALPYQCCSTMGKLILDFLYFHTSTLRGTVEDPSCIAKSLSNLWQAKDTKIYIKFLITNPCCNINSIQLT